LQSATRRPSSTPSFPLFPGKKLGLCAQKAGSGLQDDDDPGLVTGRNRIPLPHIFVNRPAISSPANTKRLKAAAIPFAVQGCRREPAPNDVDEHTYSVGRDPEGLTPHAVRLCLPACPYPKTGSTFAKTCTKASSNAASIRRQIYDSRPTSDSIHHKGASDPPATPGIASLPRSCSQR
jgi:hypothetical protein